MTQGLWSMDHRWWTRNDGLGLQPILYEEIIELNAKINTLEIEITNLKYFIKEIHRKYTEKINKLTR